MSAAGACRLLDAYKARILLYLALAAGADAGTVAAAVRAAGSVADAAPWPWRAGIVATTH